MKVYPLNSGVILCLLYTPFSFSQSKKEIKEYQIKSTTEIVSEKGVTAPHKDSYTAFDKNGNITEFTEFNKDGTVKTKQTVKYNSFKNKTEEVDYEGNSIVRKRTYSYNADGEKEVELTYDGKGKIIKKEIFKYNNKGLRSEKKVYDASNTLLETHLYTYQTK